MNNLYVFRMKAIFRDKLTCIIIVLSVLVFLFIVNQLSLNARERSSIPIGLLNSDQSESANQLAGDIKEIPAFYVYEGTEKELKGLLYKEQIHAFFVIEEGYEKWIQTGKTDELITMYYLADNKTVKILSDIFAGEMLYKICLYKGYNLYHSLPEPENGGTAGSNRNKGYSENEYMDYAKSLTALSDFDFAFDISMINVENQGTQTKLDNSVIYLQVIWGILGMLLSFMAMLMTAGIVLEKEAGMAGRIKISLLRPFFIDLSHLGAALTVQGFLAILLCIILGRKLPDFTFRQGGALFLSMMLFSLVMGLWFLFLGKFISRPGIYQLIGIFSILLFGLLGFLDLTAELMDIKLLNISKIIPNCWFIDEFTDIILRNAARP